MAIDLPVLALNEVFIGESLSSRVSYYELKVDSEKTVKQKSSGLTICTGLTTFFVKKKIMKEPARRLGTSTSIS